MQRVADSVVADRPDAFGQRSLATLGLDLKQAGNLHGGTQEDGIKHLLPGVLWKLSALRQGSHQIRKAKHLVEISLEPVPGQAWRSSFSLRNRFRLTPQMVAAAASKRRRISIFWRTFSANSAGMLKSLGLSVDQHGDLKLRVKALSVSAMAVGPATGAFAFDKRAGQHFAERAEAADEFAAQFQVGFAGHFHMTLILVSETRSSQGYLRNAKMPQTGLPRGRHCE